jgi:glutaryl-CoA transferase
VTGSLDGVLVADFSRVLSGPYCTMVLGDLGADVVKVERPGSGDETRGWGPPFAGGESAYYLCINRNKRSVGLDLLSSLGREAARRLVERADVLVENFRPGTMERLGLGYEHCHALNPRLVYASMTGFGLDGPYRDRPGYDFIIQGMGGVMSITGDSDGPPEKVGVAIADITAGLFGSIAILAALRHREVTGEGQRVHSSLLGSHIAWLANQASNYLVAGMEPHRMGNLHPNIVPYQVFEAADAPFVLAVANEPLWARFCAAMDLGELRDDPRYATNAARVSNRVELADRLGEVFATKPRDHWIGLLSVGEVPAGPINSIAEVFADPFGASMIETVAHPTVGELRLVRSPLQLLGTPVATQRPPPLLGEHTAEVLAELGFDEQEITRLTANEDGS